jgi:hypothetical protein
MNMGYRLLADIVVVIHGVWVAVVILGLLAILIGRIFQWRWVRNFWFRAVHFAMIAIVAAEALLGITCPLTVLEDDLRRSAGDSIRSGSFIGRWVHDLLFYELPPWVFTVIYCVFAAIVLATFVLVPPKSPFRRSKEVKVPGPSQR